MPLFTSKTGRDNKDHCRKKTKRKKVIFVTAATCMTSNAPFHQDAFTVSGLFYSSHTQRGSFSLFIICLIHWCHVFTGQEAFKGICKFISLT